MLYLINDKIINEHVYRLDMEEDNYKKEYNSNSNIIFNLFYKLNIRIADKIHNIIALKIFNKIFFTFLY
jgi:hypothetical protein